MKHSGPTAAPNRIRHISTESAARDASVTLPMNGLSRERHVRQQHVEMPLVHRDVGRLAHRPARVVHPLRHVGELHEVAEILDRRIPPPPLHVPHEGRPVDRRQHQVLAADGDVPLRVARVLHILPRRRGAEAPRQPLRQMHPVAAHVGPGPAPELQRRRVVGEPHAGLLQHRLGIGLDQRQPLLVEDLVGRDPPPDERRGPDPRRRALRPPRRPAAAPAPASGRPGLGCSFAHRPLLQAPRLSFYRSPPRAVRQIPPPQAPPATPSHGNRSKVRTKLSPLLRRPRRSLHLLLSGRFPAPGAGIDRRRPASSASAGWRAMSAAIALTNAARPRSSLPIPARMSRSASGCRPRRGGTFPARSSATAGRGGGAARAAPRGRGRRTGPERAGARLRTGRASARRSGQSTRGRASGRSARRAAGTAARRRGRPPRGGRVPDPVAAARSLEDHEGFRSEAAGPAGDRGAGRGVGRTRATARRGPALARGERLRSAKALRPSPGSRRSLRAIARDSPRPPH